MAQYKEKQKEISAEQFVIGQPLPPNVQVNALSSTGYSYGDLLTYTEPDDPLLVEARNGFEISDRDFIITDQGRVTHLSEAEFNEKYEVV